MKTLNTMSMVVLIAMFGLATLSLNAQDNTKKYLNRSKFVKDADLKKTGAQGQQKHHADVQKVNPADVAAKGGVIDGTSDGPNALTDEEIKHIRGKDDIYLSGKTGEIRGTSEDKKDNAPKCPKTGFNIGSPRQELILAHEDAIKNNPNSPDILSDEEIRLLKSNKDIVIDGKTGEIRGTKAERQSGCPRCEKTGLNIGSPLHNLMSHHHLIDGTSDGPYKK